MKDNLVPSFAATMAWEGGEKLSLDPRDPGNWTGGKCGVGYLRGTKYGVSAAAHPELNIRELSINAAADIFKRDYWDEVAGDGLPAGLDHCVSDDAYNAGPTNARRLYGDVRSRKLKTVAEQIGAFSEERLSFLRSLRIWSTFGRGWTARVAGVEAESLRMAKAPPDVVQGAADEAQARSSGHVKIAAQTGAGGGGAAIVASAHLPWWAILAMVLAVLAIVGVFVWKSQAHAHRAEALQKLATEAKSGR